MPKVRLRIRITNPFRVNFKFPDLTPYKTKAIDLLKQWFLPHRRDAMFALGKATILLAALWEYVWLWHTHYYVKRYPELPLSLAWAMLTVIAGITIAQAGISVGLKKRGARRRELSAESKAQLTVLLASYIAGEKDGREVTEAANNARPQDFEECVTFALIGTRGYALERIKQLPGVAKLRETWTAKSRKGGILQRRHSVERLSLLRDPATIMALEVALEDANAGVVAAAVRGLLRLPEYTERDKLLASLPTRPYLVRVLTAGEASEETRYVPPEVVEPAYQTREVCSSLANYGSPGRDLLHLMAALGRAGDAPAEALGELLAAGARGGR